VIDKTKGRIYAIAGARLVLDVLFQYQPTRTCIKILLPKKVLFLHLTHFTKYGRLRRFFPGKSSQIINKLSTGPDPLNGGDRVKLHPRLWEIIH
jgi:hypothetical protein